jgi:hypothetical protein
MFFNRYQLYISAALLVLLELTAVVIRAAH